MRFLFQAAVGGDAVPQRNLLDVLGLWPTVERILDYFRGWNHSSRLREATTIQAEAAAKESEAKARQAAAEAARMEVELFKEAADLAEKLGFPVEQLSEADIKALGRFGDMVRRGRILTMRTKSDRLDDEAVSR
jgi:hypothetical protein